MTSLNLNKPKATFFFLFGIILIVAILTPHIVHGHIWVPAEYAQSVVLFLDLVLGYVFYRIYKRDLTKVSEDKKKAEENLLDSYKYIGKVNVQKTLFNKFINSLRPSQHKNHPKNVFNDLLATIINSIIMADKGLIRFIDVKSKKTIAEFYYHKHGDQFITKLSNREILENKANAILSRNGINILQSDYTNNGIRCLLAFSNSQKDDIDQELLKTLLNQTHLLFLTCHYSKDKK